MTDIYQKSLNEFIDKFDPPRDPAFWKKLIEEETKELAEALANLAKEAADVMYVVQGYEEVGGDLEAVDNVPYQEVALAALDALNALPSFIKQEVFTLVHQTNMSKLGDDGKPVRREDGKILKGPNYAPPDVLGYLEANFA